MSGKMINIGGDENDANYRYKMSPLQTKIEGRGNGIKTVLMNISEVAKQLHTQPQYATKFFGMEVGAVSRFDSNRDVGIVNGVHQTKDLQKMLKTFIREFILCQQCNLPELQFKIHAKKGVLLQKCASCGWKGQNGSNHKVKTYIINHPPPKKAKKDDKKKDDKKVTKKSKQKGKKKTETEQKEKKEDDYSGLGGGNDEIWSVDVSENAVASRKQKEMQSLQQKKNKQTFVVNEDEMDDKDDNNAPAKILRSFIYKNCLVINNNKNNSSDKPDINNDKKPKIKINNSNLYKVVDEIKRITLARNLDKKKSMQVVFDAVCNLSSLDSFIDSLKHYSELFSYLTSNSDDSKIFFGVLEEIIARRKPDILLQKCYLIFEAIYDSDIVSEENIMDWHKIRVDNALIIDKDQSEKIRKYVAPFIEWLQEEDEEDDDEEDDNNDE